jgi:hypothetical protein
MEFVFLAVDGAIKSQYKSAMNTNTDVPSSKTVRLDEYVTDVSAIQT